MKVTFRCRPMTTARFDMGLLPSYQWPQAAFGSLLSNLSSRRVPKNRSAASHYLDARKPNRLGSFL